MRVAAIDIGTNTTRLLVADVDDGRVDEVERLQRITRLGEGVDAGRLLLAEPVARVRATLSDFRQELERLGAEHTLAVATSAVRDAANGDAFLDEIARDFGFDARVVSGDEEAQLTYRGVTSDREVDPDTLVIDVGGGSTELIAARFHASVDVGSARLTERCGEDVAACARAAHAALPELPFVPRAAIGVAGTITSIASLELGGYDADAVHGYRISRDGIERQLARLAALPLDERRRLPGLDPERAPVIVAGVAIVGAALDHYGLDAIEVSERDLLHGAAIDAAELPEPVEGEAPPGAYTCC
jgi:exopolyphosphatase / guanosine-5'-triphosphate,3'-diphosphate pyrophosphatase